jgi:hypothetical protein
MEKLRNKWLKIEGLPASIFYRGRKGMSDVDGSFGALTLDIQDLTLRLKRTGLYRCGKPFG